jgi:hypothetical protein
MCFPVPRLCAVEKNTRVVVPLFRQFIVLFDADN